MVLKIRKEVMLAASWLIAGLLGAAEPAVRTPAPEPAQWRGIVPGSAICIAPIRNMSGRSLAMPGLEHELAAQLEGSGYRAGKLGEVGTCDATVYSEIVSLSGRARVRAELEFRLVLAGEQAPRLSTTVTGRSPKRARQPGFGRTAAEQDAILAALARQSHQILAAQQAGMELYAGAAWRPQ